MQKLNQKSTVIKHPNIINVKFGVCDFYKILCTIKFYQKKENNTQ